VRAPLPGSWSQCVSMLSKTCLPMNCRSVAQTASLPYRRLPVGRPPSRNQLRRLAACDTAGWATCATGGAILSLQGDPMADPLTPSALTGS